MLILIDAAQDALAEMIRLIDLRPALATDELAIELRRQLEEDNFFRLWLLRVCVDSGNGRCAVGMAKGHGLIGNCGGYGTDGRGGHTAPTLRSSPSLPEPMPAHTPPHRRSTKVSA